VITRFPDPEGFSGKSFPDSELVKNINQQNERGTFEVKGLDGVSRIFAFSPVKSSTGTSYSLVVGIPIEDATWQFRDLLIKQFVILLVVLAAIFGTAIIAINRYSRRIRSLTKMAGE